MGCCHNKNEGFQKNTEQRLKNTVKFVNWTIEKPGRPTKEFGESRDRSKRRKTEDLSQSMLLR